MGNQSTPLLNDYVGNLGVGISNPTGFKVQVEGSIGPGSTVSHSLGSVTHQWSSSFISQMYGTASVARKSDTTTSASYADSIPSTVSVEFLTASKQVAIGPNGDHKNVTLHISASNSIGNIVEVDTYQGREVLIVSASGWTYITSGSITGSLWGTASIASTASSVFLNASNYWTGSILVAEHGVFIGGISGTGFAIDDMGYLTSVGITSSLYGTASHAVSASYAPSSAGGGLETGSTYPITASWAESASNAVLSLFSETADYALDSQFSLSASYAISTSYVQYNEVLQLSSSYASSSLSASYAKTASYVVGGYTTPTFDQTASTWQVISGSPGVDIYNTKTIQGESQQVIRRNWRANNNSMSLWVKSPPNPPYSIVLGFEPASIRTGVNYTKCGILLYDSSSKKIVTNCLQFNNQWQVAFLKYTSPQTYNSGYTQDSLTDSRSYCPPILLAVTDDGTNLTSSYSLDGGSFWFQTYTVSRTDFLTTGPNQIGILIDSPMALVASGDYTIFHYTESAPINFVNLR